MRTIGYSAVFISLLILSACGGSKQAISEAEPIGEEVAVDSIAAAADTIVMELPYELEEPELILSLARTSCYGNCPVYSVKLYSDRSVVYRGRRYVSRIGFFNGEISEGDLDSILIRADALAFGKLSNKYPEEGRLIADLPNTVVGMLIDGTWKEIVINHGAPQDLLDFTHWLDDLFATVAWTILPEEGDNRGG